jgi:hypothetical protein
MIARRLLIRCARSVATGKSDPLILELCRQITDWEPVVRLAARNKVAPLLYRSLQEHDALGIAPGVSGALCEYSEEVTRRNAVLARSVLDILLLFDRNGVLAVPYRGPVLSQLLYGSFNLRQMSDLDFMVPVENFDRAGDVLVGIGFRSQSVAPGDCSRTFHRKVDGFPLAVDLHSRLARRSLPSFRMSPELILANVHTTYFLGRKIVTFTRPFTLLVMGVVLAKEWIYQRPILAYALDMCRLMKVLSADEVAEAKAQSHSLEVERAMKFSTCVSGTLLEIDSCRTNYGSMIKHAHEARKTWSELSYAVSVRGVLFLRASNLDLYDKPVRAATRYFVETVAFMPYRLFVPTEIDHAWLRVHRSMRWAYPMIRVARVVATYFILPFVSRIRPGRHQGL